jgi:hypothetical protein
MDAPVPAADELECFPPNFVYRRPRPSLLYQLTLVPVGLMMLLLPVLYILIILCVSYVVYYHGTHNFNSILAWGGLSMNWRVQLFKLAIYAAPLIAGIVLVFFMIKPIFAARGRRAQPYALNPEVEPRLFAFITRVCQIIGASPPRRIDLGCDLNASAGFRRGFRSLFGSDFVLALGMPLVATLSVEEFAAVLAHEFGHFTQGVGMRASYVIRSINGWFARVVFERDAWDQMLEDWARESHGFSTHLVILTAQAGVWISRAILYLLMMLGHLLSSALDRQKEFNADAHAINAVGSEVFERMIRRLALLDFANAQCLLEMQLLWKAAHALPDNFPLFLANKTEALTDELKTRIDDRVGLRRTGLFDTHPSEADRIRQARRLAEPGFLRSSAPASSLFENFPVPAGFVTLFHYQAMGIPITRDLLRPIQMSKAERAEAGAALAALLDRYFSGMLPLLHPFSISPQAFGPPADAAQTRQQVREFRPRLAAVGPQIAAVMAEFNEARRRQIEWLTHPSLDNAAVLPEALATQEKCRRSLQTVAEEWQRHLASTLSLLHLPSVAAAVPEAEDAKIETRAMAAFLRQFSGVWPVLEQCRATHAHLAFLRSQGESARDATAASAQNLVAHLARFRDATVVLSNPFEQRKRPGTLYDRFAGRSVDNSDPAAVDDAARRALEGFTGMYENAIGRLAALAEKIEGVVASPS